MVLQPAAEDARRILTPDQRVRVFVSSTLEELAAERGAARRAIERLGMAPVMFELGARAHPPRSLYRAYLEQSHVFLAVYGQRYGWVAPGMDVSGLEDEYLLAGNRPKLVYVRRPASGRDDRLSQLLGRIRDADDASYKSFETPEELEQLIADDLAALLAEAFLVESIADTFAGTAALSALPALPVETTSFVGRADEIAQVHTLLARDDVRMLTLTGPGGIGKTRLALRIATEAARHFDDGAVFVALDELHDGELVVAAIADAVGVVRRPGEAVLESLERELADRSLLLVIDNFEHVVSDAPLLASLIERAPRVKLLVTSREALRLRAEHEFAVPPLSVDHSVRLFEQRAEAIGSAAVVDEQERSVVHDVCRRLDGLPLAIELAAARSRLLSLDALRERLERPLDFLVGAARDLPERQRALRSTIAWSHDLLDDEHRRLFARLSMFSNGFSLAAAERTCSGGLGCDMLDALGSLVDKSLLRAEWANGEPRFRMLDTIADFARERFEEQPDAAEIAEAYARFYRDLIVALGRDAEGRGRSRLDATAGELSVESANVRRALDWHIAHGQLDDLVDMAWALWVPAWIAGRIEEGRSVLHAALAANGSMAEGSSARLQLLAGVFDTWNGDHEHAAVALEAAVRAGRAQHDAEIVAYATLASAMLAIGGEACAESRAHESLAAARQLEDHWAEAAALNVLGWLCVAQEHWAECAPLLQDSLDAAIAVGDEQLSAMAEVNLAELCMQRGRDDDATALIASSIDRHRVHAMTYSLPYTLDAAARLAARRGNADGAAVLLGAASSVRDRAGIGVWGSQAARRDRFAGAMRSTLGDAGFDTAHRRGRALSAGEAIEEADPARAELVRTVARPRDESDRSPRPPRRR